MSEVWGIAIFLFVFIITSSWILRRFYFSKDVALLKRLRLTALIVETATTGLFFFPWLPEAQGGFSGWDLVLRGNTGITILLALLLASSLFFLTRSSKIIIIGSVSHIAATVFLFIVMIQMMPGTVQLTLRDTAPIIAVLLMLINTVIVLLLWHQLQKQNRPKIL